MSFDKAALFAALKPKTKEVPVEGFGILSIKQLAVAEVEAVRAKLKKEKDDNESFGLRLLILSVFDDGAPVFTDDDLPAIQSSSNEAVEKLVGQVLELNGFKKADTAKN